MNTLPQTMKEYKYGKWSFMYSEAWNTLFCYPPRGATILIKASTHTISALPKYVMKFLEKNHLLDFWREAQQQKALDALITVRKRMERIESKTRDNTWISAP